MAIPFLRWAGGKRQLLPLLHAAFDSLQQVPNRYYEPFLGGGALFLNIFDVGDSHRRPGGRAVLGDRNEDLVNCYQVVKEDVDALIELLNDWSTDTSESGYYKRRDEVPTDSIERAARLVYLNRLCFNGLYRLNRSGKFNVPYGHLKRPTVCNEVALRACSASLQFSDLRLADFSEIVGDATAGDFVYLDPPYAPLEGSTSFASYHNSPFGHNEHLRLASTIKKLTDDGVMVVLSNSDTTFTRETFKDLYTYSVVAKRNIGASASSRAPVRELIAANFQINFQTLESVDLTRIN